MHVCRDELSLRFVKGQSCFLSTDMHLLSASGEHSNDPTAEIMHPVQALSWLASRT